MFCVLFSLISHKKPRACVIAQRCHSTIQTLLCQRWRQSFMLMLVPSCLQYVCCPSETYLGSRQEGEGRVKEWRIFLLARFCLFIGTSASPRDFWLCLRIHPLPTPSCKGGWQITLAFQPLLRKTAKKEVVNHGSRAISQGQALIPFVLCHPAASLWHPVLSRNFRGKWWGVCVCVSCGPLSPISVLPLKGSPF